mmetsp:Transcript_40563/g.82941  ORF Transcript_40563/g.82941 Transcript_40563/m.82941 type:complete len:314 (+) Transcript_40563:2-943(+)
MAAYGAIDIVRPASRRREMVPATIAIMVVALTACTAAAAWYQGGPVVLEDGQPTVEEWPGPYTAVPYRVDPRSGITQWTASPLPPPAPMLPGVPPPYPYPYPYAGGPPPALAGAPPPAWPNYVPPSSVNTWSPYPYGPLPPGAPAPMPLPGLQSPQGPMYGPPPVTQIVFNSTAADDKHITINIPQPPTMVSFPPVKLDPKGAPFGSTPNTAEAFNAYTQSTGFGAMLNPAINMSFSSKPVRIMPPPMAPPTVDLFTGTGPNDEPPYHIAGTTAGFYSIPDSAVAKKQARMQALYLAHHRANLRAAPREEAFA